MYNHTALLKKIGLSENESVVYIALLKLGRSSVQKIAEEAGVKRPTVYLILDDLRKKGFALQEPSSNKTRYIAKDPKEVIHEKLDEINEVRKAIPELKAIQKEDKRVNVLYFEGPEGMKNALMHRIDEQKGKDFVGFYAKANELSNNKLSEHVDTWNDILAKNDMRFRGIAPDHASLKKYREQDSKYKREVKIIPQEKYSSNMSIDANDAFVRIILLKEMQSIIIESPEAAKTVREIFELLWEKLE